MNTINTLLHDYYLSPVIVVLIVAIYQMIILETGMYLVLQLQQRATAGSSGVDVYDLPLLQGPCGYGAVKVLPSTMASACATAAQLSSSRVLNILSVRV